MKIAAYIFAAVTALVSILSACSSDECLENKNALPLAGFYSSFKPDTQISIDSLEVYGAGVPGDSILWAGNSAKNELYLPFRLDSDTTEYVFRYRQKALEEYDVRDTVTFVYKRVPRFVSSACGASYLFEMRDILTTGLLIDSVACPSGEISNVDSQNLKIYFRAVDPERE